MTTSSRSVVIHGHFYQPPREDPWLETVEAQPSAAPYHDWNHRVEDECYRAVVAARVPGSGGRIAKIINALEHMSFNFGPTLLEWMEAEAPGTYRSILDADAASAEAHGGHGNAIAQAYHHSILPLASRRDKVSEVRWGIADFRHRFGRDPAGMWLPETAIDGVTLDVLAQEGIAFTIVAPHQVENPPPHGLPGLFKTPGGRSVAIFVYNGPLSHGVAFGALLKDSQKWAEDMVGSGGGDQLISIATDGETYGHHHRFGEMALAAVLERLQADPRAKVENFASFLARQPAEHEVTLVEPSSWSCSHGVDRWKSDCGCKMAPEVDTQQRWRSSLRDAMEWLATQIHQLYETEAPAFLGDPWAARDRYGPSSEADTTDVRARELLELERQALLLFTSCGWFFDDLAGIEPLQVLRYAARALDLAQNIEGYEGSLVEGFLSRLDEAVSNEDPPRRGREIFLAEVLPKTPAHLRMAGGAALLQAMGGVEGYSFNQVPGYEVFRSPSGTFHVIHNRTGRDWEIEAKIFRPSSGRGAVAVREVETGADFLPLHLADLPESLRDPITRQVGRIVPDTAKALVEAVEALGDAVEPSGDGDGLPPPQDQVDRVRDLADLHILLGEGIPFDAQTTFFRFLKRASPEVQRNLDVLRKPLGFTTAS